MPLTNCRAHNTNASPERKAETPDSLRKARNARAYYRNRANRMQRMRKYYETNKEQQQARFRKWYEANKEALLERRRAQRRQAR